MNSPRLIINADDFGMSRGITDGIILAHRYGVVTSASLMANMPAAEYALSRLEGVPALGVGIHLNICADRPILPPCDVSTLVGASGHFHPPAETIRRLWTWHVSPREIEAEFRAQIRWLKWRGITPTHVDSHHHTHIYPAAVLPFARALKAEGVRCARAPQCSTWPKAGSIGSPHEGRLLRRLAVQAYRIALQRLVFRNLDMPESRISFVSCDRHNLDALGERWKTTIASLPPGTFELACHPGLFERGFSENDRISALREAELQWLADRDLRNVIERTGVHLISYRDLAHEPAGQQSAAEAPVLQ